MAAYDAAISKYFSFGADEDGVIFTDEDEDEDNSVEAGDEDNG